MCSPPGYDRVWQLSPELLGLTSYERGVTDLFELGVGSSKLVKQYPAAVKYLLMQEERLVTNLGVLIYKNGMFLQIQDFKSDNDYEDAVALGDGYIFVKRKSLLTLLLKWSHGYSYQVVWNSNEQFTLEKKGGGIRIKTTFARFKTNQRFEGVNSTRFYSVTNNVCLTRFTVYSSGKEVKVSKQYIIKPKAWRELQESA